jgi:2-furoyl-CoA dehydrogenase large subunit
MKAKWVGSPVKRKEDQRLIAGKGRFVEDINLPGMLHAAILRSPYPHARIKSVDTSKAERLPGVKCVLTGEEVKKLQKPIFVLIQKQVPDYCLAVGKVRYVGEPVAAVAATDKTTALNALELIQVEYEPIPPVLDAKKAMDAGQPLIFEDFEKNIAWHDAFHYGDVDKAFEAADTIISEDLTFHRYCAAPIEPSGCIADYSPDGTLTVYDNCQASWGVHFLFDSLNLPANKIKVIELDIGGAFGGKATTYVYSILISLLSMKAKAPVKWIERRDEYFLSAVHSGERYMHVEAAAKKDGTILSLKTRVVYDGGAYIRAPEPAGLLLTFATFVGCYKISSVDIDLYDVFTNKCPGGAVRGYGTQHQDFLIERVVDLLAKKLGLDRAEIRFKNFIQPEQFPYLIPTGSLYDSGNYPKMLQRALKIVGYDKFYAKQKRLHNQGRYVGLGITTTISPAGPNFSRNYLIRTDLEARKVIEALKGNPSAAKVSLRSDGKIIVSLDSVPQGQGHETVASQIVADELSVHYDDVITLTGHDSTTYPTTFASGTFADKFAGGQVGSIVEAAKQLKTKLIGSASKILNIRPEDLYLADGKILARSSKKSVTFLDLAGRSEISKDELSATATFDAPVYNVPNEKRMMNFAATYASQAHAAIVEVDKETGTVMIQKYVMVHDAGTILNPLIVEGQMIGGLIHGLGGAMYERLKYSEDGQLLTSSFRDYLLPTTVDAISPVFEHQTTPSPYVPLGCKGVGMSATEAIFATLASAIEDALSPLGVKVTESFCSPEEVWKMIQKAPAKTKKNVKSRHRT